MTGRSRANVNTGCLVARDLALLTKVRTVIHEEISLLTVLYFPFRARTPTSILCYRHLSAISLSSSWTITTVINQLAYPNLPRPPEGIWKMILREAALRRSVS